MSGIFLSSLVRLYFVKFANLNKMKRLEHINILKKQQAQGMCHKAN